MLTKFHLGYFYINRKHIESMVMGVTMGVTAKGKNWKSSKHGVFDDIFDSSSGHQLNKIKTISYRNIPLKSLFQFLA